jgi:formamidopyrimidine-DNA glycosylase
MAKRAVSARIEAVRRRGKYQVIELDNGFTLLAHFRMTGDWVVLPRAAAVPKSARAIIHLDNDTRIVLADPRALGSLKLHEGEPPLPRLGEEPLSRAFTPKVLGQALATRKAPIKPVLLDQSTVAGVGNIYASEALWLARIDPRVPASSLGPDQVRALTKAIRETLRRALRTPARYQDSADIRFKAYDREGEPCERCGEKIERITQANRSTYFCPACQRPAKTGVKAAAHSIKAPLR